MEDHAAGRDDAPIDFRDVCDEVSARDRRGEIGFQLLPEHLPVRWIGVADFALHGDAQGDELFNVGERRQSVADLGHAEIITAYRLYRPPRSLELPPLERLLPDSRELRARDDPVSSRERWLER